MGIVAVLTLSRAIVAFVAAALIRTAHHRRSRLARLGAVTSVAAAVGAMVALTIGRLYVNPAAPESARYVLGHPVQNPRLSALESSWTTSLHHPLLGIGPGSFPGTVNEAPFRAHFTPVNVAATVGFPALAAVALFVTGLWRGRRRPTEWATWSGLIGLGIDGLGQDIDHFRHVWVMLGLADAQQRRD
jgi:O-antigen ligase